MSFNIHRLFTSAATAALLAGVAGPAMAEDAAKQQPENQGLAQDQTAQRSTAIEAILVTGRRMPLGSKMTSPLRDTPQTITIIPQEILIQQNTYSLRDTLTMVPGITFGAGEGGGGYGDSITLRGYAANTDITYDGIRDSAQYTRSDSFNTERVEVINGANSVYAGAGAVGGSINIVTKRPVADQAFTRLSGGVGTDSYGRASVDTNHQLGDGIALRVNGMWHHNDVPGRDVEKYERWGAAPSFSFGLNSATDFTLSFLHQEDDNIPQYGVPYFRNAFNNGPLEEVDPSDYFGYSNVDRQDVKLQQATVLINHHFNNNLSARNLTRWQQVTQYAAVNPPQGTWCLSTGINVATGESCTPRGQYTPTGPRGTTRDSTNKTLVNQTDFIVTANTGAIEHNMVAGVAVSYESYALDSGNALRNPNGALPNPVLPNMTISAPNSVYTGPVNFVRTATQDGKLDNTAFYLFDTTNLTDELEINGGVRWERNDGTYTSAIYTNNIFTSQTEIFENDDILFSYRAGIVYKPQENGTIYAAVGNAKTPSKSSVNGACTAITCNVDPESARNYEIGTKWDVMENRLSLTASLFRNERTNYKVPSNDPTVPDNVLDGRSRVTGIALGVAGTVTDEWLVFANYTNLKSKVLQGVSDFCLANPTTTACAPLFAATSTTPLAGNPLTQVPDHAFNLWTTYDFPMGIQIGYGITYQGQFYLNNGGGPLYRASDYWTHRAMLSYAVNDDFVVRLNVTNIFNEAYYTRVRNNGWATPGDTRSAVLSVDYAF